MPFTVANSFEFFRANDARRDAVFLPEHPCRAAVSLHSHTMFSEESLDMVPRYTGNVPVLGRAIREQEAEYRLRRGRPFDFGHAFWTPPLGPRQAYRLEEKQIQRRLQLPALVSLSDHDDIRAPGLLRVMSRFARAPISTEWTVPFGTTFFHIGVHNLPPEIAATLHLELAAFTAEPDPAKLGPLLDRLSAIPDLLLVLNHPLWDEKGIGVAAHRQELTALLRAHATRLHALELNGLRSWRENREVLPFAQAANLPVVSGGDRHGREPNAILNLTEATTFSGFVEEVRYSRRSHILFMPQYHEPLRLRVLQTMVDVVRHYPENALGRRLWSDRVFYRDPVSKSTVPLSEIWTDGGPQIVRHFIRAMRILGWSGVQSALRLALEDRAAGVPGGEVSL